MKLAIVGSRNMKSYILLKAVIDNLDFIPTMIISGCANGADDLAYQYAKEKGITFVGYPPSADDKKQYGFARACRRRNLRIVETAEFVVAFPSKSSKGTWHTVGLAKKLKVSCKIVKIP